MKVYILKEDNTLDFEYECPVDVMEVGKFLLPSVPYTTIPPPDYQANKIAVFIKDSWVLKEDFRGTRYWVNGIQYQISNIGEVVPSNASLTITFPEIAKSDEIIVTPWQIRQAMNELGLRSQVENLVRTTSNQDIKDGWEYATEWKEFNPFVQTLGQQLGLTSSQIHAIFVLAKQK